MDESGPGRIIWLASYPKSGNTWLRALLTNYITPADSPADINELAGTPIASSRALFDDEAGVTASDLTAEEIARYRPGVYRAVSAASCGRVFMKAHDAFTVGPAGPLFPPEATACAVYILRNPLDVAVSLAEHLAVPIDIAVSRMCDGFVLATSETSLAEQLDQSLLSWSDHVNSWVDQRYIPVHTVRYEDLLERSAETFAGVVRAVGLSPSPEAVARAVECSSFETLRAQERRTGFKERSKHRDAFFARGRSGGWRKALPPACVERLIDVHWQAMHRFHYIAEDGTPT